MRFFSRGSQHSTVPASVPIEYSPCTCSSSTAQRRDDQCTFHNGRGEKEENNGALISPLFFHDIFAHSLHPSPDLSSHYLRFLRHPHISATRRRSLSKLTWLRSAQLAASARRESGLRKRPCSRLSLCRRARRRSEEEQDEERCELQRKHRVCEHAEIDSLVG